MDRYVELETLKRAFEEADTDVCQEYAEQCCAWGISKDAASEVIKALPTVEMTDYERGYNRALTDINQPKVVVAEAWNPSECPRCGRDFAEFEPCDDGYYDRAMSMERCPYCGQKLCWR